jgi:hypothetical protein
MTAIYPSSSSCGDGAVRSRTATHGGNETCYYNTMALTYLPGIAALALDYGELNLKVQVAVSLTKALRLS